jgi:hypothetical protein
MTDHNNDHVRGPFLVLLGTAFSDWSQDGFQEILVKVSGYQDGCRDTPDRAAGHDDVAFEGSSALKSATVAWSDRSTGERGE